MAAARAILLGLLAILTALGVLPEEVRVVVEANADALLSGVMGAWAIVAGFRAWKLRTGKAFEV